MNLLSTSVKEESRITRALIWVFKLVTALSILYYVATEYVLYWYLDDHYKTTTGVVVAKESFSDGGVTYRYEYFVESIKYSKTSQPRDYKTPPEIGERYSVKYLEIMPSIAVSDF